MFDTNHYYKAYKLKCQISIFLLFSFFFLLLPFSVFAQSEEDRMAELRNQIEELERQAGRYRDNIASEREEADSLKKEISIIQNQINKTQTQIYLTGKRIDTTEIEIESTGEDIFDTESTISYQKATIAELLLSVYRRDNESLLVTLVKNNSISDFFREAQYSATINESLLGLIGQLKNTKDNLHEQKDDLEDQKYGLERLNNQQYYEKLSLSETRSGKDDLLYITKGQEAQYQSLLEDIELRKSLFFTELRELETHIIQGGLYLVHIKAENIPPKGTTLFEWPEDDYRITQGYGRTSYARRGAYGGAPHNGVDMAAGFGSPVKAIGRGEIIANGFNDGWGNWVAIKHTNNMVSLYGHMSSLSFLRVGTQVQVGDVIGFEGSTGNSTGSHLHLSLYREFFTYIRDKDGQLYFNYFDGSINPYNYL